MFWKSISSHTHAFLFLIFNALRCVYKNQVIFSKKMFFQIFNWSILFFNQSESFLKILVSLCLVRLIELIEHRESGFFETWILTFSKVLQVFSLSLIQTWLPLRVLFFFFNLSFCKVSLSKHRYDPFTPYFCFYFHISRIFNLGISNYA